MMVALGILAGCSMITGDYTADLDSGSNDADVDSDTDTDADTDTDSDADSDADTDTDSDTDSDTDTELPPEIDVESVHFSTTTPLDNGDTIDFGEVPADGVGGASSLNYYINVSNSGAGDLQMSIPTLSGADSGGWVMDTSGFDTFLIPSDETSFVLEFEPIDCKDHTATVSIINDDPDENPFEITLEGVGSDIAAPLPEPGDITFSDTTTTDTLIMWPGANDNCDSFLDVWFKLVRSDSGNIGDVTEAEANGTTVMDWNVSTIGITDSGLSPGATYWYNTLVRDSSYNTAAYEQNSVTLPSSKGP